MDLQPRPFKMKTMRVGCTVAVLLLVSRPLRCEKVLPRWAVGVSQHACCALHVKAWNRRLAWMESLLLSKQLQYVACGVWWCAAVVGSCLLLCRPSAVRVVSHHACYTQLLEWSNGPLLLVAAAKLCYTHLLCFCVRERVLQALRCSLFVLNLPTS